MGCGAEVGSTAQYSVLKIADAVITMRLAVAWATMGAFAFANLRVGAQLTSVPAARFALGLSVALAIGSCVTAMRAGALSPAPDSGWSD